MRFGLLIYSLALATYVIATTFGRSKSDSLGMKFSSRKPLKRSKSLPDLRDSAHEYNRLFATKFVPHHPKFLYGKRIVAIGDLHGDFGALSEVLQITGLVDGSRRWIGGDTTVVQTVTGDGEFNLSN